MLNVECGYLILNEIAIHYVSIILNGVSSFYHTKTNVHKLSLRKSKWPILSQIDLMKSFIYTDLKYALCLCCNSIFTHVSGHIKNQHIIFDAHKLPNVQSIYIQLRVYIFFFIVTQARGKAIQNYTKYRKRRTQSNNAHKAENQS